MIVESSVILLLLEIFMVNRALLGKDEIIRVLFLRQLFLRLWGMPLLGLGRVL